MIIDEIVRTDRKTIAITIQKDGRIIIRAPRHTSNARIQQFMVEKQDWILSKQRAAQERAATIPCHQFQPGEIFLYLGNSYPLEWSEWANPRLELIDGRFLLAANFTHNAGGAFTHWYRQQAKTVISERVRLFADIHRLHYDGVSITAARTRWGSCSAKGRLRFTWRLMMAPLPVVDYVVVHELAHLVVKNHSQLFWGQVASMMSDYAQFRQWLKDYGHQLFLNECPSDQP